MVNDTDLAKDPTINGRDYQVLVPFLGEGLTSLGTGDFLSCVSFVGDHGGALMLGSRIHRSHCLISRRDISFG